jgi:pyruvate/2-oxoglutarate dehydrogenase complex dihydrolipoamide dehydrogenase (E3) component
MPDATHFDAIIIGTGQAGPPLAFRLAAAGKKVAIIERARFGGTCVNTGCIPTKAMVASAYAIHLARRLADFGGVVNGQIGVDFRRIQGRKEEISAASRTAVEAGLRKLENCTVYDGQARFEADRVVTVADQRLTAPMIFINVGGRAKVPDIPGLEKRTVLTNSSMMTLDTLPRHLLIIGGSYIGLEFGQMFRRFGSDVTILEHSSRLLPHEDEDVSQGIHDILNAEGIRIEVNAKSIDLDRYDASHILVAAGRRPNTDDLGLEKVGVKLDPHGFIEVDDQLCTSTPGIWALGDCNGKGAFTHTSYNDFEIVAANLLDGDHRRVSDRILTYGLFIDPPLGRAGMTEAEVRASGRKALKAVRPMTKVGRAFEKSETQGFMKILVDAETKLILGASLLGTGADEVVHLLLDIMYAKQPYTVIQRAVHIHPTVSELIPTMLGNLKPI